jgi:hypothetical protein
MILSTKQLTQGLNPLLRRSQQYISFGLCLLFLASYAFFIVRISRLVNSEPGPEVLSKKVQTAKRIKIDQYSVDKLLQLQDEDIEVKTLFQEARNNPFTEPDPLKKPTP